MIPPTIRELLCRDPHETNKIAEHTDNHRYYSNILYNVSVEKLTTSLKRQMTYSTKNEKVVYFNLVIVRKIKLNRKIKYLHLALYPIRDLQ